MNVTNLKSDIDFLCGSTSATYPDADKIRNINISYHDIATLIWESDGTWAYDDSNNTDAPVAYRTVANASASYTIPTTALRVEQVEIKDGNGDWQKLRPISLHDITISPEEYLTGTGTPIEYMLNGNEIRLFPAPGTGSVTMSSGMAVRLSRGVTEIATTASTYTPGFATPYHRILSLAAAIDFTHDPSQRQLLVVQKDRLEKGLTRFYSKRGSEFKTTIKPAGKKRWRNYL